MHVRLSLNFNLSCILIYLHCSPYHSYSFLSSVSSWFSSWLFNNYINFLKTVLLFGLSQDPSFLSCHAPIFLFLYSEMSLLTIFLKTKKTVFTLKFPTPTLSPNWPATMQEPIITIIGRCCIISVLPGIMG